MLGHERTLTKSTYRRRMDGKHLASCLDKERARGKRSKVKKSGARALGTSINVEKGP